MFRRAGFRKVAASEVLESVMQSEKPPIMWLPVTVFLFTTIVTVIGVPWYGYAVGYSGAMWLAAILVLGANGMSITAGYHRLWAHNSYRAHWSLRLLFALFGAAATQNSILVWASGHRRHHRHVDDNERDPYSAKRGFFFSHIGWMLRAYPSGEVDFSNVKDLQRDPIVVWQHKHYVVLAIAMNFIPALALGWLLGDIVAGALLIGFLRLVVSHHTTFFINSLAHIWGRRPYTEANTARDNDVLAFFTYGEGYHNYHHLFQGDYRNGVKWWQYDPTKWLIFVASKLGLASKLKRTPAAKINQAMIETQLKRAEETFKSKPLSLRFSDQIALESMRFQQQLQHWKELRLSWVEAQKELMEQRGEELRSMAETELLVISEKLAALEFEIKQQRKRMIRFVNRLAAC